VSFKGVTGTVQGIVSTAAIALDDAGNGAPASGPQKLYLIDAAGKDQQLPFGVRDVATLLD
jgi:hypothetical protein